MGFAEETLFRGIILRSLRTKMRAEFWVMLWSSLWFGFFHATNLANGSPLGQVVGQCLLASTAGVLLYFSPRWRGLLVLGMVAHGLWDMSVFLPASDNGNRHQPICSGRRCDRRGCDRRDRHVPKGSFLRRH